MLSYLRRCLYASSNVTKQELATEDILKPTSQFLNSLIKDIDGNFYLFMYFVQTLLQLKKAGTFF